MPTFERIIPLLVYKDIQAAHDFLVRAFGFESGGVESNADGHPMHGEVRAGRRRSGCTESRQNMSLLRQVRRVPVSSSMSMTLTHTTTAPGHLARISIANRRTCHTANANTERVILRATGGGLRLRKSRQAEVFMTLSMLRKLARAGGS
jgi:uncharacterized glyoxalase superfamily protein PhnB